MNPKQIILKCLGLLSAVACMSAAVQSLALGETSRLPNWLNAHVGAGNGQIAPKVLEKARA